MTPTSKLHDSFENARYLGRSAAWGGRSLQSNPYKHSGTNYSNAWLAGYRQAKAERKALSTDDWTT